METTYELASEVIGQMSNDEIAAARQLGNVCNLRHTIQMFVSIFGQENRCAMPDTEDVLDAISDMLDL
jgi:hypothetical protein